MADCVFCGIVAGTVPAFVVADEEAGLAFLDTRPVFKGHVLIVPRPHIVQLTELPAAFISGYFGLVQRVSRAVPTAMTATGTFVAMNNLVSQSVPHLHTHVVPRTKGDGLRGFFWPRHKYASDDEAAEIAARIGKALR
ncbi:HIT family protein [Actinoplanes awajinensis]|uniref:HIT family hydrolase n=1 Tax=Actinoplanes awajinensis subsp. mycoplanecinus TaxID=135947 RepID=A0A0X3UVU7_9ACTN|nr:HIT family protein [Actinoplanes awajinensis]KUL36668.1 HIT family hydrolase [Actinoplanes awajinensis subsp. mycoplanecinus]